MQGQQGVSDSIDTAMDELRAIGCRVEKLGKIYRISRPIEVTTPEIIKILQTSVKQVFDEGLYEILLINEPKTTGGKPTDIKQSQPDDEVQEDKESSSLANINKGGTISVEDATNKSANKRSASSIELSIFGIISKIYRSNDPSEPFKITLKKEMKHGK